MGKKKGKKGAGETDSAQIDDDSIVTSKKDDIVDGLKKLGLNDEKPSANNDDVEFFEPSDDERSKKKKKGKTKNTVTEEPQKEPTENNEEPEFFEPSDDDKKKKKKKNKNNQQNDVEITETQPQDGEAEFYEPSDDEKKKKKKKKGKATQQSEEPENEEEDPNEVDGPIIKTKAQKLAEKKERERLKKERQRQEKAKREKKTTEKPAGETQPEKSEATEMKVDDEDEPEEKSSKKKKDKKSKKEKEAEAKTKKKKPNTKMLAAMQENLKKIKEEEERIRREEEEKERKEEEARQLRLKKLEEERLKKERKKQKEKDRKARQKAEGTYLTPAQREAQKKREAYLETLREQGLLPTVKKERPKFQKRPKKQQEAEEAGAEILVHEEDEEKKDVEPQEEVQVEVEQKEEEDDIADDWEETLLDSESEESDDVAVKKESQKSADEENEEEDDEEDESESESEEESESESESEDEDLTPRQCAEKRIMERKARNEKNRSTDDLRSPVICVMGHVDTGKTKILDKIRHSHVQDGEAGGITQQIGATFVPLETIREQTSMVKGFPDYELSVPGLLVIDTPGHESFSNLRSRGSSVCDMAILVVDIMHGLEPQTIESISMLKKRKTPFVVALNKIDRLYDWKRGPDSDVANTLKKQKRHVKDEFDERLKEIVVEFAKQELNVKLFYENDDPAEWISMVPTSAHSGDGMGNLIALVMKYSQTMLPKRLSFSEELQCTVLEVKAIQGLGTTIDVILTNGRLKCGDRIVLAGVEGPIFTYVKGLLMPQPLRELRVKNPYDKFDVLKAAQGVKILAKDLDKALAGTQLRVAHKDDEVDLLKEEVQSEVDKMLRSIKLQDRGVFVQASTLGSLEALLEFLKTSKIPYAGIGIGPVHKKDIMKASVMLEHDSQLAVILAFDVKVEREAQELADHVGVKIFTADIIYHLFDSFMQHRENLKKQKQEEFRSMAVFPCKLRIMPNCVFKSRDPIVVGVTIDAGQLRNHTPICIPTKEFMTVGYVTSMEFNHKALEIARAGQEVCVKIETPPGEPPKMVGRHFEETDILVSKISRDSINVLKDWFREEMQKSDWQLVIELKKMFEII